MLHTHTHTEIQSKKNKYTYTCIFLDLLNGIFACTDLAHICRLRCNSHNANAFALRTWDQTLCAGSSSDSANGCGCVTAALSPPSSDLAGSAAHKCRKYFALLGNSGSVSVVSTFLLLQYLHIFLYIIYTYTYIQVQYYVGKRIDRFLIDFFGFYFSIHI